MCLRACICVSVRAHIGVFVLRSRFSWTEASNVPVWDGDLTNLRQLCMSDCVYMCVARVHVRECARLHRCVCVAQSFFMDRGLK